jgi:hypothetical protein
MRAQPGTQRRFALGLVAAPVHAQPDMAAPLAEGAQDATELLAYGLVVCPRDGLGDKQRSVLIVGRMLRSGDSEPTLVLRPFPDASGWDRIDRHRSDQPGS